MSQTDKATSAAQSGGEEIPYMVIAAAIASILPSARRIISVAPSMNLGWSIEGRRTIHHSHIIPRR